MNMDPAPPVIRLYTLNVQGLTSGKLLTTLRWLREQSAHGAILTETRLTSDPLGMVTAETGGGVIWPGVQIFHTPGTGHTGGVTVILGPGLHLSDPILFSDPGHQHRILRVDVQFFNQPTCIISVYGPAQCEERVILGFSVLILGGSHFGGEHSCRVGPNASPYSPEGQPSRTCGGMGPR